MPKSKTNKDRKQNVINYKNKQKQRKTMEAPEMKPFRQVPSWESRENFTVDGSDLEVLYNFFNIFAPAFTAIQKIFARGVQDGKIKIGYEYEDGSPVPEAEISAYTEKLNEYFKNKIDTSAQPDENQAKIVDMNGAAIPTEPNATA